MKIKVIVNKYHHPVPEWIIVLDKIEGNNFGTMYLLEGEPYALEDWLEPMSQVYQQDSNGIWSQYRDKLS